MLFHVVQFLLFLFYALLISSGKEVTAANDVSSTFKNTKVFKVSVLFFSVAPTQ